MISFKKYISEAPAKQNLAPAKKNLAPAKQNLIRPQDMVRRQSKITGEKQVDFDDPAYSHELKKSVPDAAKWPPKPEAKYKADQIRWAVTAGKQPEHLANES